MDNIRLELTWPNKDKFLLSPKDESGKPVWVERSHPAALEVRLAEFTGSYGRVGENPYADNLIFQGDSLDALRIMCEVPEFRSEYRGKVKLIYIDPPFNTQQTFQHYDDWMEHSTWLSFMRDRLLLMKELLAQDGTIWVHLDDAEQHRMRLLLDEVFGANEFIATVVWQKTTNARNDSRTFSTDQDYITIYSRNRNNFKPNGMERSESSEKAYTNPDNDPRGPWREGDYKTVKGSRYAIIHPVTGAEILPPPGQSWRYSYETHQRHLAEGLLYWGKTQNYSIPKCKRFRSEVADTAVPQTLWLGEAVDTNRRAKGHIKELFPGVAPFDTPKPERLLERVIHIATKPGDIVVDVFGGSGTTAATATKMGRRWVISEISSDTVSNFIGPRLEKVVNGEDSGGITKSVGWTGGSGFRKVTIAESFYSLTPFGILLTDGAFGERFARAVAGQLGFELVRDSDGFIGKRGRMKLAVLDGQLGLSEAKRLIAQIGSQERATIVATSIGEGVHEWLEVNSPGSHAWKAPSEVLRERRVRKNPARELNAS
jgi:adenine-specific DNA-methyltransferase